MNFVADRLSKIKPSMTVGINVKAKALKDEGKDGDDVQCSKNMRRLGNAMF